MLTNIIIDDELKGRSLLKELVSRYCPDVQILGMAANAYEGIQLIKQHQPDFIFLDIKMPEINGFQMIELIGEVKFDIIFVTAYNEFAVKAYKYAAFDYLLKPIDPEELKSTIDRLKIKHKDKSLQERLGILIKQLELPNKLPTKITIHGADGITILNISDIIYLEAEGPYTIFYVQNKEKIVSSTNLKEYEEILLGHNFFRTHHSYLVNLNQIKKFVKSDSYVLMTNGSQVDVSKRKRDEFLQVLSRL